MPPAPVRALTGALFGKDSPNVFAFARILVIREEDVAPLLFPPVCVPPLFPPAQAAEDEASPSAAASAITTKTAGMETSLAIQKPRLSRLPDHAWRLKRPSPWSCCTACGHKAATIRRQVHWLFAVSGRLLSRVAIGLIPFLGDFEPGCRHLQQNRSLALGLGARRPAGMFVCVPIKLFGR